MTRRLPPDAFAYYLGLGVNRSYQAVADHFGVSKQAVVSLATREKWSVKLRATDARMAEAAAKKAEETIEQMNERHLRSLKAIQGKALQALQSLALENAMDAVRALELAIRQERVVRGEPAERTAIDQTTITANTQVLEADLRTLNRTQRNLLRQLLSANGRIGELAETGETESSENSGKSTSLGSEDAA